MLQPTPRRLRRTHEKLALGRPAVLAVAPGAPKEIMAALRRVLEPLFPEMEAADEPGAGSVDLRFDLFSEDDDTLAAVPQEVRREAFHLQVSPIGVEVRAGSGAGWLLAAKALAGLREGTALAGVTLLDWPSFPIRQIDLPVPASSLSDAALEACVSLLDRGRLNRLGIPGSGAGAALTEAAREQLARLGITAVTPSARPTVRLLEHSGLFPAYSERLPAIRVAAMAAEGVGSEEFVLSLGESDSQTALELFAPGILFAGDCAWNPRKADPKAFRRWYSFGRFSFDSRGPIQFFDELEAATERLEGGDSSLGLALETGDLLEGDVLAGIARPDERATEAGRHVSAGMSALAPLQPDSGERAAALQGMQWSARRLKLLCQRLGAAERARELYRSAYAATASPKAVSERLLKAASLLEAEARTLDEHRAEWHALWRRERRGEPDPVTETGLRAQVATLHARAARMRALRDRYIQTGALPTPAAEGLERASTHLTAGLVPVRLPPQPSPAWWPEGGAARVRLEIDCSEPATGLVWEIRIDFRALAGESGAFNVRSARLLPLTETDEAGPERPCQLLRGGIAFVPEAGSHTYFLYLDPEPGPDTGFRETRASQSSSAVRLENRVMRVGLSPKCGFVSSWQLREPEIDLLPETAGPSAGPDPVPSETGPGWRLRILETGPLLARARAEHPDGRARQFDLGAGHGWAEVSVNSPWSELVLPLSAAFRDGTGLTWLADGGRTKRIAGDETALEYDEVRWTALRGDDGLTIGIVLPESPAEAALQAGSLRLRGRPFGGRLLLFAGCDPEPAYALEQRLAARRDPPRVRMGGVEERRVREF